MSIETCETQNNFWAIAFKSIQSMSNNEKINDLKCLYIFFTF